jgi:nucleotide-binding universal stress UspA family protein
VFFSQSDFYDVKMFKNILVPTDGSDLSMKPVEPAIRCALHNQGRIVALSVSEPRLFYGGSPESIDDGSRREEQTRKEAHAHLDQIIKAAKDANVPCEAVEVQSRTPSDEIVSIANRYHCDAIFMATRGSFNVIEKLFNESQTHKVIEQSSLPVVVFP